MGEFAGKTVYRGFWAYGRYIRSTDPYEGCVISVGLFCEVAPEYGILINWDNKFVNEFDTTVRFPDANGGNIYVTSHFMEKDFTFVEVNAVLDRPARVTEADWVNCLNRMCQIFKMTGDFVPSANTSVSVAVKPHDPAEITELMRSGANIFYNRLPLPTKNAGRSQTQNQRRPQSGGWNCRCGRLNPDYVGTCNCGIKKNEVAAGVRRSDNQRIIRGTNDISSQRRISNVPRPTKIDQITATNSQTSATQDKLRRLRECQEQLDKGLITKAQYNARREAILREP